MIIHGRNIILSIDGTAFAGAKSCDIEIECDDIETSSPTDGAWRTFIAGRKSWTARLNHLVLAIAANAAKVGSTVTLSCSVGTGVGADRLSGSAIVKQWKVTATTGNLAQGSFVFKGSGALG